MICGGYKAWKEVTEADNIAGEAVLNMRPQIEAHLGATFTDFKPVHYQSQVVAGTNFKIKVQVDAGEVLHVKIFRPLPYTGDPDELKTAERGKTLEDDF